MGSNFQPPNKWLFDFFLIISDTSICKIYVVKYAISLTSPYNFELNTVLFVKGEFIKKLRALGLGFKPPLTIFDVDISLL